MRVDYYLPIVLLMFLPLVINAQITDYPYHESFENGLDQWTQSTADDLDWTRRNVETPSADTGPSAASHGSYFMYTEATGSPGHPNKTAILISPSFRFNSIDSAKVYFDYHMYGVAMGSLKLELSVEGGAWTEIFYKNGDQGNAWFTEQIELSEQLDILAGHLGDCDHYNGILLQFRFVGTTGSDFTSDMTIDNFSIQDLIPYQPAENVFPVVESFELAGSDNRDWYNAGGDGWSRISGPTPNSGTGPEQASDGNYYLYMDANQFGADIQSFISPTYVFTPDALPVLGFHYYMYGTDVDSLKVTISVNCGLKQTVWKTFGNQGQEWHQKILDLTQYVPSDQSSLVELRFISALNQSTSGDIAIDMIELSDQGFLPSEQNQGPTGGVSSPWRVHQDKGIYLDQGQVAINVDSITTNYALQVNGSITAEEIKVEVQNVPDYVFKTDYTLPSLKEVEIFIQRNGHLPGVQPATILEETGIQSGKFNMLLLRKIEELTLYMIELKEENEELKRLIQK